MCEKLIKMRLPQDIAKRKETTAEGSWTLTPCFRGKESKKAQKGALPSSIDSCGGAQFRDLTALYRSI